VGCSKPDPAIYHEVLKRSGMTAQDCLFIDDLECNIKAASQVGMHTIQFTGIANLKSRLQNLGFTV
jgi:HAD superfamily hydrolase (TIGR01509 family)